MKPYGLLSDQHCHAWSAFSKTDPDGVNNRLRIILDEMERAAEEVAAAGGDMLVFAGDLFHSRGSISPEVFNPTHDCIEQILKGVQIYAIPGNHDLQGKETTELGNAMQTLSKLDGFEVATTPMVHQWFGASARAGVLMVPWMSRVEDLRAALVKIDLDFRSSLDLIIHAPVNGVLMGIPDHGLTGEELAALGFKRVFSGHYHNHKEVVPGVFSIGATTHQTWSDVGTRAGFLIVHDDHVDFRASHAPSFVDIDAADDETDIHLAVDGNYVRAKIDGATIKQQSEFRAALLVMGAAGVTIIAQPAKVEMRTGSTVKSGATLEHSVADFITTLSHPRSAELQTLCAEILTQARSAV